MKWVLFLCGLVIGAIGAFGGLVYLQQRNRIADDDQITFAERDFYDSGDNGLYPTVAMSGTLTAATDLPPGDGLAYPNNTYGISCEKVPQVCMVASIEQIGPNQIGRMNGPLAYQIHKWDAYQIIAGDEGPSNVTCEKLTITIQRQLQKLLWVEEPINQATPFCQRASTAVRKFTLEDSPGWRKLREATRPK